MLINGQSLPLHLVKLVDKEKEFCEKMEKLMEEFDKAENCGNSAEMDRLGKEGVALNRKMEIFQLQKITIFAMATSVCPNFTYN